MTRLSLGLALSGLLLAAGHVTGAAIASDKIVGFAQTVPDTAIGQLYLKYQPYLDVQSGCVPFPAVDAEGNTNAGLKPTGDPSGGCSSSTGQIYVRAESYNGSYGMLFSWYWPKDEPSDGLGHRHDWECIVVWLSEPDADATLQGVAASAHGKFATTTSPDLSGTSPLIRYYNTWPLNHQLGFTSTQGGRQPLIAWESLPEVARTALTDTDFGDASVPFKNANFEKNLAKAQL